MNLICSIVGHNWRYMRCDRCGAWRQPKPVQVPPLLRPPHVHQLKVWPQFLDKVISGEKPFEVRKMDRNYQVGDLLLLVEWHPMEQRYGRRRCTVQITYILEGGQFGIEQGYGVLGHRLVA